MIHLILWLTVVAAAIGVQVWYYFMHGELYVSGIPSQIAIIILLGMYYYSFYA